MIAFDFLMKFQFSFIERSSAAGEFVRKRYSEREVSQYDFLVASMFLYEWIFWSVLYHHQNKFKIKLISSHSPSSFKWRTKKETILKCFKVINSCLEVCRIEIFLFSAENNENIKTGWRMLRLFPRCSQPQIRLPLATSKVDLKSSNEVFLSAASTINKIIDSFQAQSGVLWKITKKILLCETFHTNLMGWSEWVRSFDENIETFASF